MFGSIGAMSRRGTQNYKRFQVSGKASDLFKEEQTNTALNELLKKYQNHSHRATLHAEELLEDEEEKKDNSRV